MNKTELIAAAAERAGLPRKDAERFTAAALAVTAECLARGEKVQLSGFGAFEVKVREARIARNPRTNEAMEIPAVKVPTFKPSAALKELVGKDS